MKIEMVLFSLKLYEENITICVLNCLWLRIMPCPNLKLDQSYDHENCLNLNYLVLEN